MKRKQVVDEEIDSDEIPDVSDEEPQESEVEDFFTETPEDKKIRLANEYLENLKKNAPETEDIDERLSNDYEEEIGKRFDPIFYSKTTELQRFRAHDRGRPTCLAIGPGCVFSGAKDGSIVRVNLEPRKKIDIAPPSRVQILCIAYNSKTSQVASGDSSGIISLWDSENGGIVLEMKGHRGGVTGIAFQTKNNQLFSCSYDGTIKVWDCENGNCLSTLFGHQLEPMAIDFCGVAVSCGADRTVRMWKFEEEKQFVYHGTTIKASIDCVSMVNSKYSVSGSQDGNINLWDMSKKKPIATVTNAHGKGYWITAICALRFRKVFASGSYNGTVKFWYITNDNKIEPAFEVQLIGFINDIRFSEKGDFVAVQVSQEMRYGKWIPSIQEARQGVYIIGLTEIKAE
ncbi:U3 small nucleolar RNA-interacting protein 2 isoform X2 [Histomonas meleagridis]|uniref:U3 small nucleolar RNA-interacting protein 2 isoform X2 n=1 Tax=Histomonas meleagridis TaxID=135588 RepID=UPI00355A9BAE|nr:U3 small nucleolar RNA-interacting protein 2 isoform X2 [Histomonas meleagridis]KAH0802356.1 U3 small nucleolar RNA-interacting protein 2 isoform X2 [Histomonas meleagridis]